MEWFVQITGDNFDLEELSKSLQSPQVCIIREEQGFFLKSTDFNFLNDTKDVKRTALELLSLINGSARLTLGMRKPLEMAHIIRINDDKTRHIFIEISDTVNIRASTTILTVTKDGTSKEIRQSDIITNWLSIAKRDSNVAKVLRLFGIGTHDWISLYRVFEVIEEDVGGVSNIKKQGWAAEKAIKRFKHTANSPHILGDIARHGVEKTEPPKDPMSLSEARSFIEGIIHNWLRSKSSSK